jgi:hypothetical protein
MNSVNRRHLRNKVKQANGDHDGFGVNLDVVNNATCIPYGLTQLPVESFGLIIIMGAGSVIL